MPNSKSVEKYRNHRAGSRKGSVHKMFSMRGSTKAFAYGRQRGLKETTLKSWLSTWAREQKKVEKKKTVKKDPPPAAKAA